MLDADEGDHIQAIGTVRWTDPQVSTSVKVCPVRVTLGSRTDPAVSYDIEFATKRLHSLVRMCRAALCTEPLTTMWAALQFTRVGQSGLSKQKIFGDDYYGLLNPENTVLLNLGV